MKIPGAKTLPGLLWEGLGLKRRNYRACVFRNKLCRTKLVSGFLKAFNKLTCLKTVPVDPFSKFFRWKAYNEALLIEITCFENSVFEKLLEVTLFYDFPPKKAAKISKMALLQSVLRNRMETPGYETFCCAVSFSFFNNHDG